MTLLVFAPSRCFALMTVQEVSKERAKELGMEIRSKAAGPNAVWVELEFKTEGELKRFSPENNSRVELEIRDGESCWWAPQRCGRSGQPRGALWSVLWPAVDTSTRSP